MVGTWTDRAAAEFQQYIEILKASFAANRAAVPPDRKGQYDEQVEYYVGLANNLIGKETTIGDHVIAKWRKTIISKIAAKYNSAQASKLTQPTLPHMYYFLREAFERVQTPTFNPLTYGAPAAPQTPAGTTAPQTPAGTTAPQTPAGTTAPQTPAGTTAPQTPAGGSGGTYTGSFTPGGSFNDDDDDDEEKPNYMPWILGGAALVGFAAFLVWNSKHGKPMSGRNRRKPGKRLVTRADAKARAARLRLGADDRLYNELLTEYDHSQQHGKIDHDMPFEEYYENRLDEIAAGGMGGRAIGTRRSDPRTPPKPRNTALAARKDAIRDFASNNGCSLKVAQAYLEGRF